MTRFAMLGGFVLALCAAASADDTKTLTKDMAPFQGTWKVIEATSRGKPAPKESVESLKFTFKDEKLTVTENGKGETGSYSVDSKKEPATIDLVNADGKKALGIYKFGKDGKLTLCFKKGKDATRPKSFDDKEAVMMVLEKVKAKK